ncbi:nucleoside-diphosphate-sugar epimerase [Candidatus Magnetoovum chiemensis]|nr:nucleoside-diphosphate-sugar epimerase [Candidatus Magnetoovum chiemensis]
MDDSLNINAKIYVAGHRGLVGSAILRLLKAKGYNNIIYRTSKEIDLRVQSETDAFFKANKPEYVFVASAKVGGILANSTYPAQFIYDNLSIATNIIHASYKYEVRKLLFLGSSCIYPKLSPQPITEDCLLSGKLEPTNEPYAISKIAGIIMCQSYNRQYGANFISVMPTNLYGPNDNFDLKTSHVLPALIRKYDDAKKASADSVTLWGSGNPKREFLFVDDLADACFFLMRSYNKSDIINIGTGKDISIKELAMLIKESVGYKGETLWDTSMPDGTERKLLDVSKINALGWNSSISLKQGIELTYKWFCDNYSKNANITK